MKSFSLELLPEETLYSYVVRSRLLSGFPSSRDFLRGLLGTAHCQLYSNFPSYVPLIVNEARIAVDTIIDNHTLFPYFAAFLSPEAEKQSRSDIQNGRAKDLHSRLSIIANRLPQLSEQKYCPECVNKDIQTVGVAYWHISHQLPFVEVCTEHKRYLHRIPVKRRAMCLPPQVLFEEGDAHPAMEKAQLFSDISRDLYVQGTSSLTLPRVTDCYLIKLQIRELSAGSGSVHQQAWLSSLKQYWHNTLPLELSKALFDYKSEMNFPRCLLYQPEAQHHPVKHVLVIGHLFGGLNEFLRCYNDELFQLKPQGSVPYDVKDRVSEDKINSLLNALTNGSSLRQSAKTAGVSIGFAKATAIQNGIEIERRAQWLFAFERRQILDWLKAGRKTQDIAKMMECSVGSVEQLLTQFPAIKALREKLRFYKKRYQHRQAIINYLKAHEPSTRAQVQKCVNASYLWCFKNDKEWLYLNLPPEIPRAERRVKSE